MVAGTEGARDFTSLQTAKRRSVRHLRSVPARVTPRENQPQSIVRNLVVRKCGLLGCSWLLLRVGFGLLLKPSLAPEPIDGFVLRSLNYPGGWRCGHSFVRPLLYGGGEGLLRGVFGHIKVAAETDQRRHDAAPIGSINVVNRCIYRGNHDLIGLPANHKTFFLSSVDFG